MFLEQGKWLLNLIFFNETVNNRKNYLHILYFTLFYTFFYCFKNYKKNLELYKFIRLYMLKKINKKY